VKRRVSIATKIMSNGTVGIPGKAHSKRPRERKHQASSTEEQDDDEEDRIAEETQNLKLDGSESQQEEDRIAEETKNLKLDGSESQQEEDKKMTPPKKKRKRRPPLIPWKKPKDMPRRPLSAYNIFFKAQREIMMTMAREDGGESRKASNSKKSRQSPGIGFANLAKTIAGKWKEVPLETRTPYIAQAAVEKDRYNKEMVVWRAKQKDEKEKAEQEKSLLTGHSQYTGVARREDNTAYSAPAVRVDSSKATETWPHVAEAPRLSPSSHDQNSRSELVARRRPEHEQSSPYRQSYRGAGSYDDRRSELMYNSSVAYGSQGEQPYPARGGGPLVGLGSYLDPSWPEAAHSLGMNQGFERPVEVPRSNLQANQFTESSVNPLSYPDTWFEVQQPRETVIDDQGEGKWDARKPESELSDRIVSKHDHAMRIHNFENPARQQQLLNAASHSSILQHAATSPAIDTAARWRNTEHAPSKPSHGIENPTIGQQEQGELVVGEFINPFATQHQEVRDSMTTDLVARRHGQSASGVDAARRTQIQSSLQQLGTRLDTETVDFLTSLRFSPAGSLHSSSEELNG
jgi:hypothetical protein